MSHNRPEGVSTQHLECCAAINPSLAGRQKAPPKPLTFDPPRKLKLADAKKAAFPFSFGQVAAKARPSVFRSILVGLFGRNWWYVTPSAMGVSLSTVRDYCSQYARPPVARLARLERYSRRLPAWLEEWRVAEHVAVEAEFERRKLEIAGAVTQLRAYTIERVKLENERARKVAEKAAVRKAAREAQAGRGRT